MTITSEVTHRRGAGQAILKGEGFWEQEEEYVQLQNFEHFHQQPIVEWQLAIEDFAHFENEHRPDTFGLTGDVDQNFDQSLKEIDLCP